MQSHNLVSLHHIAVKNDVQQLTSKLISLGQIEGNHVDLNKRDEFSHRTPLHFAAIHNVGSSHYEVAEVLLKNGADVSPKDRYGRTPLWYLVKNCNLDFLKLFLRFKADFTHLLVRGWSLLATGNFSNLDVLKFLIENIGLDVNHKDDIGATPLHHAACSTEKDRHYEVLKYLLENGADVNARDNRGLTPLYYLVRRRGNWRVVELFLKHNADVYAVTEHERSILFEFDSDDCDLQVLSKLVNYFDLDVNHQNKDRETPLNVVLSNNCYHKVDSENSKIVKFLLKNGANINFPDKNGVSPLIGALRRINGMGNKRFLHNLDYFRYIIDQVDFSVVHNSVHIFAYSSEEELYYDHRQHLCKWIMEHLAKLKFLSLPIHSMVLEFVENHTEFKDYFEMCTKELEVMSKIKPQNSWINFFNFLVDGRRKLKNYAGNEDLIQNYENNDWLEMFPIYGALLKKNVKKGIKRRELFEKSSISLTDCLPVFNCTHLIIKDIIDCVMSKKVLSKFCK